MNARKSVVGAAAVLAAGVVSLGTADSATAQSQGSHGRITSIEQLKSTIHQAVAIEAMSGAELSCCPGGENQAAASNAV